MSIWFNTRKGEYASDGKRGWLKAYCDEAINGLREILTSHISGASSRHSADDVDYSDDTTVKDKIDSVEAYMKNSENTINEAVGTNSSKINSLTGTVNTKADKKYAFETVYNADINRVGTENNILYITIDGITDYSQLTNKTIAVYTGAYQCTFETPSNVYVNVNGYGQKAIGRPIPGGQPDSDGNKHYADYDDKEYYTDKFCYGEIGRYQTLLLSYNGSQFVLLNVAVPPKATEAIADKSTDDTSYVTPKKLVSFIRSFLVGIVVDITKMINVVKDRIGELDDLETEEKTSVVGAVNEIADTKADKVTNGGFVAGNNATNVSGGVAIGNYAKVTGAGGAIGSESEATSGFSGGYNAKSTGMGAAAGNSAAANHGFAGGNAAKASGGGAIGDNANTGQGGAVGQKAVSNTGFAGGSNAISEGDGGAVGLSAVTVDGGAVGTSAVSGAGFSGGKLAKVAADTDDTYIDAIQLGMGTNNTPKTMQVYNKRIVEADGSLTDVGDLSDLITGGKSSVVTAVNEVAGDISEHKTAGVLDHPDKSVTTSKLADKSVTAAKLADKAVTGAKIETKTITNWNLSDNAVQTYAIENGAVTAAKLADSAVTAAKIQNGAITAEKLDNNVKQIIYDLEEAVSEADESSAKINGSFTYSEEFSINEQEGNWAVGLNVPSITITDRFFGSFTLPAVTEIDFADVALYPSHMDDSRCYLKYTFTVNEPSGTLSNVSCSGILKAVKGKPNSYLEIEDGCVITALYIYIGDVQVGSSTNNAGTQDYYGSFSLQNQNDIPLLRTFYKS